MSATARMQFSGFAEADSLLSQLPILLRGRYLNKAMKDAMDVLVNASARMAPQPGASSGGIAYTLPRGARADRKRLYRSIASVIRKYNGGETVVAVGGPVKHLAGRHAHLVEFGFHHTSGGTFAGSGGRTRRAQKQIGVRLTRLVRRGGELSAANMSDVSRMFATRRISEDRLDNLRKKFATQRVYATAEGRTGKGRRNAFIEGRSYVMRAFNQHKQGVQDGIIAALRTFAAQFAKRQARAARKAAGT